MRDFCEEIVAVHILARVFIHMKFVTGGEGTATAGTGDDLVEDFFFLHAKLGYGVAFGLAGVNAGVIVNLVFGVAADFRDSLDIGHEGGVGSLKIIVGKRVFAGPQFLLSVPTGDEIFVLRLYARIEIKPDFVLYRTVF